MILDRDNVLFDAALTKTGTSNVLDLGQGGDAIGQELTFHNVIRTTFAGATSLTIQLETCDTAAGTYKAVVVSPAIAAADLTAGNDVFCVRVPKGLKRFVRITYTVAGSTVTAGAINSFVSKDL